MNQLISYKKSLTRVKPKQTAQNHYYSAHWLFLLCINSLIVVHLV